MLLKRTGIWERMDEQPKNPLAQRIAQMETSGTAVPLDWTPNSPVTCLICNRRLGNISEQSLNFLS